MAEHEGDDKTQQNPGSKGQEQQVAQLLGRQRQLLRNLLPPNEWLVITGIFSAYLLLVGTIIAFGVLASYAGHKLTQEICFWIAGVLLLAIPIFVICYLRATPQAKPKPEVAAGKKLLLERFAESSFGRFLSRHSRAITFLSQALAITQTAEAIRLFPKHPRFSLVIIVYFIASSFVSVIINLVSRLVVLNTVVTRLIADVSSLLDIIESLNTHVTTATQGLFSLVETTGAEVHKIAQVLHMQQLQQGKSAGDSKPAEDKTVKKAK